MPVTTPSLRSVTSQYAGATDTPQEEGLEEGGRVVAALGGLVDPGRGWTTPKVVVLVLVSCLMTALLTVTVQDRMSRPAEDSVDVGFLRDMIDHHEQAVQLGVIGSRTATDDDVAHFALEAVVLQQYEIGQMQAILEEWGYALGDPDRDVMAWMGMPTSLDNMPGMASDDQMRSYRDMTGPDANEAFLRLMYEHHRGGIHMAVYARDNAADQRVAELGGRMARNQIAEMHEYAAKAERLGFSL